MFLDFLKSLLGGEPSQGGRSKMTDGHGEGSSIFCEATEGKRERGLRKDSAAEMICAEPGDSERISLMRFQ